MGFQSTSPTLILRLLRPEFACMRAITSGGLLTGVDGRPEAACEEDEPATLESTGETVISCS